MAWWQRGNQTTRPADIDATDWVPLFAEARAMERRGLSGF